jgi:hypothetical protein
MHIGLEVRSKELIILFIDGTSQIIKPKKVMKLKINQDSIKDLIDFRKNFQMLLDEEKITTVSMVKGGDDSSNIRRRIEYVIEEVCFILKISHKTFASSAMNNLKEKTFKKDMAQDLKSYLKPYNIPAYSENAFLVAWRYS